MVTIVVVNIHLLFFLYTCVPGDVLKSICPVTSPCVCSDDATIQCASRRIRSVPEIGPSGILWHELDMSENIIENVQQHSFTMIQVNVKVYKTSGN